MFSALKDVGRLLKIVISLVSYGILPYTSFFAYFRFRSKTYGQRICMLLQSLGPTFIKLGQSLASRPDIVGSEVAENLLLLCDKMPSFPFSDVVKIVESELHKKIHEVFSEFSEMPVSAASISQVHKARTLDGEWKAVKVLRPNIEVEFQKDINLMRRLERIFGGIAGLTRFKLRELIDTFFRVSKFELDLRFEAANADELRKNMRSEEDGFRIPEIDWQHTTRRVLTLQWMDGIPIYRIDELSDRDSIARKLVVAFCNQVYRDRYFHADMHPGNLMVDSENRIVAVDFGIMGRIDEETRFYISEIFLGFLSKDYEKVADAHYDAGYIPCRREEFATACRAIWEPIADVNARDFSMAQLLTHLFKITEDFDMDVQPQLLLLQKTMVLVEGICRQLSPEVNLWKIAEVWVKDHYESYGCMDKLRESKVYKCARNASAFVSKIDKSLDIVIAHNKKYSEKKNTGFLLYCIILLLIGFIIFKL
ncbi:2-polyprenylphenol 6-hydroxylase [Anaplasma bovis]|uniref:2-polyprenylphenol 6-hydroxylase n=1 Tax=Anaplasma bovis TaxID=186733 RepID=UPI002FF1832F